MKKYILLLSLVVNVSLQAKHYSNCDFKNPDYTDICKKVVKKGVSYDYANRFLLNYFKTQKFDEISWKYLKPKYIKYHKHQEKKANNVLLSYVPKMVENLKKHAQAYRYAEVKYGVNKEIIAAILLKETKLGQIKPTHDAFVVFNTLLTRLPNPKTSREKWLHTMSKTNMATIITYCYKKGLTPQRCNLPSSYAGAVGIPQFMPNSFVYAESYKDGIPDLTDMDDAIVSTARYLNKKAKFDTLIDWRLMPDIALIEQQWYDFAFKNEDSSLVYEKSTRHNKTYKCFLCKDAKYNYLKKYVKKIMRYNNSSNYAIGVIRLAYEAHKEL